jgi:hypothetical protein
VCCTAREIAMPSRIDDTTIPLVSCVECRKQVPKDEAHNAEAADYVAYFCGLDCYQKWLTKNDAAEKPAQ